MATEKGEDLKTTKKVEEYVLALLGSKGEMTTRDILEHTEHDGLSCPDEPVRFLTKLRMKGLINGRVSMEHKGWIWWV
ncbi:MAG: hypothetical protein KAJ51_15125 [Thermoplasmata archaeon]|nr:hypothetical protein [Thermoplasmata archaeon]